MRVAAEASDFEVAVTSIERIAQSCEESHQSLLYAACAVAGLSGTISEIEARLETDADRSRVG